MSDEELPHTFDPLFDADATIFVLPGGIETDDAEMAVEAWRKFALDNLTKASEALKQRDADIVMLADERDQLKLERDRAELAFRQLHPLHGALMIARDENSTRIIALRDRIWALEAAIRKHRDQEGDDRCFEDDYDLYAVLPEGFDKEKLRLNDPAVMLAHCARFVQARHDPSLPYRSPQREIDELRARVAELETELAAARST